MRAHTQARAHALTTPTAVLRRVRRRHRFHALASAYCLESEDREEVAPAGVLDRCGAARLAAGPVVCIAPIAVTVTDAGAGAGAGIGAGAVLIRLWLWA